MEQIKMDNFEKPTRRTKFKSWLKECYRVLKITKKPGTEEYKTIVKISGIGMGAIGLIGFVINMIKQLLF